MRERRRNSIHTAIMRTDEFPAGLMAEIADIPVIMHNSGDRYIDKGAEKREVDG
jgi:hypothetical protein